MTQEILRVEYPYIYDLYYRVRNAILVEGVYCIPFYDWVEAGLAFNVHESVNPYRKISYFAELHRLIAQEQYMQAESKFRLAVIRYYEDLYQLYQDHLTAQLRKSSTRKRISIPPDLVIIPTFDSTPALCNLLESLPIKLETYIPKHIVELRDSLATIYAEEDSLLFRGAGLYFDYGVKQEGNGILLEVI